MKKNSKLIILVLVLFAVGAVAYFAWYVPSQSAKGALNFFAPGTFSESSKKVEKYVPANIAPKSVKFEPESFKPVTNGFEPESF